MTILSKNHHDSLCMIPLGTRDIHYICVNFKWHLLNYGSHTVVAWASTCALFHQSKRNGIWSEHKEIPGLQSWIIKCKVQVSLLLKLNALCIGSRHSI
ncbi:hypothetical protein XENTR_v10006426 [Xenopus tropicalis]|nr:hypothetical protein XENTR_v10006426 [Xenopus tropicalis]